MNLPGRIVVVTGASGGVGKRVTLRWLEAGACVVAASNAEPDLARLADDWKAANPAEIGRLLTVVADVTHAEGASSLFRAARKAFGEPADTLLHLVGGFDLSPFDAADGAAVWERMLEINVMSAVHGFRAAIPGFRERGGGWIVAISARAATVPSPKASAYAASKSALLSLVGSLAAELRDENIHVSAILPSTIDTPGNRASMGEANSAKWVKPDEIADATIFLATSAAANGTTLELYARA